MTPTRTITTAVVIALFGCSRSPDGPPPPQVTTLDERLRALCGEPIQDGESGAWTVRRLDRAGGRTRVSGRALSAKGERSAVADGFAPEAPASMTATAAPAAPPLRAGATDDHADHRAFAEYLAESFAKLGEAVHELDVAERRWIHVVGSQGAPLPGARVRLVDLQNDTLVWSGTSMGDGRLPFYPGVAGVAASAELLVEAEAAGASVRQSWKLSETTCRVQLDTSYSAPEEVALDVVFLIDTTGSMGDEIQRIKDTLSGVTDRLQSLSRESALRYGAVLYRDVGDDYVTKQHAFTADLDAFAGALQEIEANGGGDGPESLNQGLAVAIDRMQWRANAAKLVFLIADAPPHMDYAGDVPYGDSLVRAIERGVRIHAVAASGLDAAGSCAFRQIAHFTRGKFIFIEYGGDVAASAAAHGVSSASAANNLDAILFAQIRDEIAGWGRARSGEQVSIR